MKLFYSDEFVRSDFAFDTTKKAKWVADSLAARPVAGVSIVAPLPVSAPALASVHDADYVNSIRTGVPETLACTMGFPWDAGRWPAVLASNGGAVAAALEALRGGGVAGSLSTGLHHAKRARGSGFCTFNGLAIAAEETIRAGAGSVLILDLDAHCGGGTHSLIAANPRVRQLDVSTDPFDYYQPGGRATLDLITDADTYLPTIQRRLDALSSATFDVVLYNAGMDPCEDCSTGGLAGVSRAMLEERERLVFAWARQRRLPLAFVLAGGYTGAVLDEAGLVALHRLTIEAAAR